MTLQFENDPNVVILTSMAPINLYADLFWRGMSLAPTFGSGTVAGLVPDTGVNMAGFNPYTDFATLLQGAPAMTVAYQDSPVTSFDVYSFAYGCASNTVTTIAGLVLPCTMTVTGFDKEGHQVHQESFNYISNGQPQQRMQQAQLAGGKGWMGIHTMTFSVSDSVITQGYIDTVSYKVYQ